MRLSRRQALQAALLALGAHGTSRADETDPIRDLLTDQVEIGRTFVGYVAAIIDAAGPHIVTAGRTDADDSRPLDGASVFEIGSITKVFTALLLADMARRGEVALSDPVADYLPPQGRPPPFDDTPMTLLDLATYTSGLPNMPADYHPADPANPYADFTVEKLYAAVTVPPRYYPGSHYEYANLGFALLGHALALRAGRSYEELVVSRICDPLGLDDTRITLTPSMQARLLPGHDVSLHRVANWDLPAASGAGALRSTANDLVRFLDAAQGRTATPLAPAFATLLAVRRQMDSPVQVAASGWFVRGEQGDELVWKDGGTGGYASFIGYSTRSGRGAVLLSNTVSWGAGVQTGWHMLNPKFPAPELHRQIAIDAAKLDAFAGRYALTPEVTIVVTPRDGRLMAQLTGQSECEVFPEGDTRFFYRVVNAQLRFVLAADGTASAVILRQNGRDRRARRIP